MIDATCLEALLREVQDAIDTAEGDLRGFEKYLRLPLKPETGDAVQSLLARIRHRLDLLRGLAGALRDSMRYIKAVLDDGYPDFPVSEVSATAAEDLARALADVASARAVFRVANVQLGAM